MTQNKKPCSEHAEQVYFVQRFRLDHPTTLIVAIPNGGARSRLTGAKLKAEGVIPGMPDLYVPAWALWVEMKRSKGGTLSAVQRDVIGYLRSIGHEVIVGYGAADALRKVELFLKTKQ